MAFYFSPDDKLITWSEIKKLIGIEVTDSTSNESLNNFGIYPINKTQNNNPPTFYNSAVSYSINGTVADEVWTPTSISLSDAVSAGVDKLIYCSDLRLKRLRKGSKYSLRTLLAAASQLSADRATRFGYWITRIQSTITELDTNITDVEAAANVDAINDIVTPAWGTIAMALDEANPTNLLASDYGEFFSKNYANSGTELYFPSTDTTVTYSAGFAATASVVTEEDPTVQIRVTSTGVVIDEFCLKTVDSTIFANNTSDFLFGFNLWGVDEDLQQKPNSRVSGY